MINNLIRFMYGNSIKNIFQGCGDDFIGDIGALFLGNKANIPMSHDVLPILSKVLPSQTLDSVSRDGLADFSRNRYAQATAVKIVFTDIGDKMSILKPIPGLA